MILKKLVAFTSLFFCITFLSLGGEKKQISNDNSIWKAGVAQENITPTSSVWMAGYASRTAPSEGKLHDLWAKAITLEDALGNRSVLITMDLLGIPKNFSDTLREKIKQKYGLTKDQIMLSCSHTHSGPVVARALEYIYPMEPEDWAKVDLYTEQLEKGLLRLVGESIKNMTHVRVYSENGIARFQVNRRNNKEHELTAITNLNGPNDFAVPVLKVEKLDKSIMAIIFGYACHPTTLSINKFSGDYAGFAQIEIEKMYPGAIAMFIQGAGADQNPLPRRSIPLAIQYGKQLAASVEAVLSSDMKMQKSKLICKYSEVELLLDSPPSIEELREISKQEDFQSRWAKGMIDKLNMNGTLIKSYPYPIQLWKIGDQSLFALGGEVLVSYAIHLKELFGTDIFVFGYVNDIVSYIPSAKVIIEGGYEGDTSQRVYGFPAKWNTKIESIIINGCKTLSTQ